ncbi:nucleotidyltransferase [Pseudalkalibacillus sp. SCS-8]|uniref:nucleotidyltransferase domain-containing protein n=1 Tax=Pseudalkalibacillus nanhaiensis TaxID=3115291 RepID=UPI0032DB4CFB
MVLCKTQFNEFHNKIRLKEENELLKSKRDIIIKRIKEHMPEGNYKSFEIFNQGSYAMHTGIKPIDDDYDIDVGLYFDMSKDDITPLEAKQLVFDAIGDHTNNVKIKKPCVTVTYSAGYHVDIAIYAASNSDGKTYLAKGKPTSNEDDIFWDLSNPKDLIKEIRDHLSDVDDRKQFRRIVRYLKRWKDEKFTKGNGMPTGIALTSCIYHWLCIQKDVDPFTGAKSYRDLDALINVVDQILSRFTYDFVEIDGEYVSMPRLYVNLPVEPWPELFEKMTYKQMTTFKKKLENLLEALKEARGKSDPTDAAEILQQQFGNDFPVPPRPATGKRSAAKAVIPSSESAKEWE